VKAIFSGGECSKSGPPACDGSRWVARPSRRSTIRHDVAAGGAWTVTHQPPRTPEYSACRPDWQSVATFPTKTTPQAGISARQRQQGVLLYGGTPLTRVCSPSPGPENFGVPATSRLHNHCRGLHLFVASLTPGPARNGHETYASGASTRGLFLRLPARAGVDQAADWAASSE